MNKLSKEDAIKEEGKRLQLLKNIICHGSKEEQYKAFLIHFVNKWSKYSDRTPLVTELALAEILLESNLNTLA